jgi:hypothetical protein
MSGRGMRRELRHLRERVGPPEEPGQSEARERQRETLETIHRLIIEHGDDIDRNYRERVARGEEHLPAIIAAKREALGTTEEGRRAWAVGEALEERSRGRGDT